MKAIEIKNITKKFKDKTAVNSLSFDVSDGEIFALLGQNGAGKTTLIKMLCCLTKATEGDALIYGKSVNGEAAEIKKIINVSPQETAVAPNLTVFENLVFTAQIYGADSQKAKDISTKMLKAFSLENRKNEKAKNLSGGLSRRLSIAMALISEPKLVFLDEPTLGLDVRARRELWSHILALKGKTTVVLTTHYLEEAEKLADKIAIIEKGNLVSIGTLDELKKQYGKESLEDIFLSVTEENYEA